MDISWVTLAVTILLGLGVAALGEGVPYIFRIATKSMLRNPPAQADESQRQQWEELMQGDEGGRVLGYLERLIFFGAFLAGAPLLVGVWLAFKVASKWEAWTNIIAVPKELQGIDTLDFLIARRRWGQHVLMTFLIGTAFNVLVAMIGAAVALGLIRMFG